MKDPEEIPGLDWRDHFALSVVVVLLLLATAAGVLMVRQQQRALAQAKLERVASEFANFLDKELELDLQAVSGIAALFAASERVDPDEFSAYGSSLLSTRPAMRAVAFARVVLPDERAERLAELRASLGEDFVVWRPDDAAIAPGDTLLPIVFVEPEQPGTPIRGLDHYAAGARRAAVRVARDLGTVIATDPVRLVNDPPGARSLLLFQPVYTGRVPATLEGRREGLFGMASGVMSTQDLVRQAFEGLDRGGSQLHVFDLGARAGRAWVASWPFLPEGTEPPGFDAVVALPGASAEILAAGHSWALVVTPEGGVLDLDDRWPLAAAGMGLLLTLVVGLYLAALLRQRRESVLFARRLQRSNAELEVVQRRLDIGQRLSHIAFWEWDVGSDELWWSDELYRIYGLDPERTRLDYERWRRGVAPEERDEVERYTREQLAGSGRRYSLEHDVVRPDGGRRRVFSDVEVVRDAGGQPVKLRGSVRDITEEIATEESRRQLEEQLRHSQRMEAVGQLTGGIAHDFGSVLGRVSSQLELAAASGDALSGPAAEALEQARAACQRGSQLVRQLLAFSRRQALEPRVLDVAAFLEGLAPKLQGELGSIIRLQLSLPAGLWMVEVDEPQLRLAASNIARNARDAMAAGGVLHVAARNERLDEANPLPGVGEEARPGDYVALEFRDEGQGMDEETARQAIDPFFTTRSPGAGVGLGLSMVYGFARQSGGFLRIESEVDVGTTVTLWLPRHPPKG